MAKIMVEMDPSQARGLDSMQQNIRERITEVRPPTHPRTSLPQCPPHPPSSLSCCRDVQLEQRLQTGTGPPSPLADGSQPLWPTTMRALSSFETTVEQALVGMTGLLRASVLQWLGSVREVTATMKGFHRKKSFQSSEPLPYSAP
jgi:hypothetical protein